MYRINTSEKGEGRSIRLLFSLVRAFSMQWRRKEEGPDRVMGCRWQSRIYNFYLPPSETHPVPRSTFRPLFVLYSFSLADCQVETIAFRPTERNKTVWGGVPASGVKVARWVTATAQRSDGIRFFCLTRRKKSTFLLYSSTIATGNTC